MSKEEFLSHRSSHCSRRISCQTCAANFPRVQALIAHLVSLKDVSSLLRRNVTKGKAKGCVTELQKQRFRRDANPRPSRDEVKDFYRKLVREGGKGYLVAQALS